MTGIPARPAIGPPSWRRASRWAVGAPWPRTCSARSTVSEPPVPPSRLATREAQSVRISSGAGGVAAFADCAQAERPKLDPPWRIHRIEAQMMDLRLRVPEAALLRLIDDHRVLVPPTVLPVQRDADALRLREALVGPVAPVELCEERAPH